MATVLAAPSLSLDGPQPVAPEYSLLAQLTPIGTTRLAGAAWWPYPAGPAKLYPHCATGSFADKDLDQDNLDASFAPFTVYMAARCSPLSVSETELRSRARLAFEAIESQGVEMELANGIANPDNPHFGDANADLISGAQSPVVALALLERAIANTGRKGLIHADPAVTTAWAQYLQSDGEMLTTIANGTQVISGDGYSEIDPAGGSLNDPVSEGWAFATGPVLIYRSEMEILFGFDQTINDQVALAERGYLVTWDTTPQTGVLVDFTTTP
jgi:hypothetical protein